MKTCIRCSATFNGRRCRECVKTYLLKWRTENKDKMAASRAAWNADNQDKVVKHRAIHYIKYKESVLRRNKAYIQSHPEKAVEYERRYRETHPQMGRQRCAKRRASKLQATPAWANKFFMEEAYDLAIRRSKLFGFKWHVDHIVPLRSKLVCGLHVEHNLQVIPEFDNLSKHNRHWPDMP